MGARTGLRRGARPVRVLVAWLVALGSLALGGVVAAAPASAAVVSRSVQLRGVAGNCLTAEGLGVQALVTMRGCGLSSARQNWNIINWPGLDNRHSLQLTGNPGVCLGTVGDGLDFGTLTALQPCDPDAHGSILWRADDLLVGRPRGVRDWRANRCLDVRFVGTTPGTPVWLWDCNNDSNAQIWLIGRPSYSGRILGVGNLCLTAARDVPENGDALSMQACGGALVRRQAWVRINGVLMLGGRCLEAMTTPVTAAGPPRMWTCLQLDRQQWTHPSTATLRSGTNVCLDVVGGIGAAGATLATGVCTNRAAQGWYLNRLPTRFVDSGSVATQLNGAMFSTLADCRNMIHLTLGNAHLVVMKRPAPFWVKPTEITFTDGTPPTSSFSLGATTAAPGWANRAAMNAQFFVVRLLPTDTTPNAPQGDIYVDGDLKNPNPFRAYEGFYVAASDSGACADWAIGPTDGDPNGGAPIPDQTDFAMGGARPLVVDGAAWGMPSEPGKKVWPTITGRDFAYYEPAGMGKPTIGVRGDGIVMMIVQEHAVAGRRLTQIRDAYRLLGFKDAVMFDGSDSSTLAVNGALVVRPGTFKNDLIPSGLAMATR